MMFTAVANAQPVETFTNPIIADGQDPWVTAHEGAFYYSYSTGRGIALRRSQQLHRIGEGEEIAVWEAPDTGPYSQKVWAPELHRVGDRWFIYFAADDGDNRQHRMYVLVSNDDDPLGPYTFAGKIADTNDRWAIDGTVYQHHDGRHFFIWSGWPGKNDGVQNLYIASMSDALRIEEEGVLICEPTHDWESAGDLKVNEGPQVLRHGERVQLIYSAGGSWTDDYCLGRLTFTGGDPMDPASWQKHPAPVFKKNDEVFGPGHASFVHIDRAEGSADWIVYHAAKRRGSGWDRNVRLQPYDWNDQGEPVFGEPVAPGESIPAP